MIVWKDVFTKDELLSDGMKNVRELENGLLLACDSYNVTLGGGDYGIANNDEEAMGAGGDTAGAESVNVVVDAFKLQNIQLPRKDFQVYIKKYSKRLKEYLENENPSRVAAFMEGMKEWVPKMLKEFDEYEFYMGPSCDPDALLVLAKYEGESHYPTFLYLKDGLAEEKF
ncbi:similar to translationally controlled tumor protein p23 [Cyanidioschyzon merolae strain 10D]|jgi:hypothetical protein|uniref:Similar to translationally controlled tumor protein p23 n=1 Tax=Cyanidioschyzon merolae (strain NIES-3377 / 10D) TaxID=280699 RepID=M1VAB6_CYAM1|nr:similar to translationally controlled tumor protein p23 [Cyanidioschyzon merolae strain 10D]BAM82024.1 similar to translationally controlled tumor protein p23 [Cyanidioschyzon merolae strain 10D]|eukprot:XP_005538060.1 similar to translationally controlled tumor protein p23 [Cyanidioschyzon merolae strain 10D]